MLRALRPLIETFWGALWDLVGFLGAFVDLRIEIAGIQHGLGSIVPNFAFWSSLNCVFIHSELDVGSGSARCNADVLGVKLYLLGDLFREKVVYMLCPKFPWNGFCSILATVV